MFHLHILKNHSLVLTCYALIQNHFNLVTFHMDWCLLTAEIVDIIAQNDHIWMFIYVDLPHLVKEHTMFNPTLQSGVLENSYTHSKISCLKSVD